MSKPIGQQIWSFPAGFIPVKSHGKEPDFVSQDKVSVLNTSREDAQLQMTIYFQDGKVVEPFKLIVEAERMRSFRVNDLIFPHAIPLGVAYGCHIESNVPVVVQFSKLYSVQQNLALMGTMAYAHSEEDENDRPVQPDFTVGRVW